MSGLYDFDKNYIEKYKLICGVDEAGRGPLAGPVCVAAVILNEGFVIEGINDSKKLTEKRRELLYPQIISNAKSYNVIMIDEKTIDEINILNATMLGMKMAVEGLEIQPSFALIDGNKTPPIDNVETLTVIKGDSLSASIAAASILAKVTRDRYMIKLGSEHPEYLLEKHKGYGTEMHYKMIDKYGVKDFHRKSFLKNRGYING